MAALKIVCLLLAFVGATYAQRVPCTAAKITRFWAGATSITDVIPQIQTNYRSQYGVALAAYGGGGSGAGVTCINTCTCALAFSDDALNTAQNKVWGTSKLTLPAVVSVYNFFTGGNTVQVKLTGASSLGLYKTRNAKWGQFAAANNGAFPAATAVFKIGRAGNSGTTQVMKIYWNAAAKARLAVNPNPFAFPGMKLWASSSDVCTNIARNKGSIGYASIGVCGSVNGIKEALIQNLAGVYVSSASWDIYAALPRNPLPATGSWTTVKTVWTAGQQNPPIASFIYSFVRTTSNGNANVAIITRTLTLFWAANMASVIVGAGYAPVQGSFLTQNRASLSLIKA